MFIEICRPLVIGDPAVIERAVGFVTCNLKDTPRPHQVIRTPSFHSFQQSMSSPLDGVDLLATFTCPAEISAAADDAAFRAVKKVIDLALAREIDATVTAPIHKEALVRAGHHFPGHTEIFAHFTGTRDFTMMLAAENLRVVHVSTHMSLRDA